MPVTTIIRRTKTMGLRKPGLDSSKVTQPTVLLPDFENGKVVNNEHGKLQELDAKKHPRVSKPGPYLNRRSEEFFTNPAQYTDEWLQEINKSLPSSPFYIGSPEPLIGIALGDPDVDVRFINEPKILHEHRMNPSRSVDVRTAVGFGLPDDECQAGVAMHKGRKWTSFAERFGVKNAATPPSSVYQGGQDSPVIRQQHPSTSQDASEAAPQHAMSEFFSQHYYPPERAASARYPRAMEQLPKKDMSRKPSIIRNDKPLRKMSWRRALSRKSHANMESKPGLDNSESWPLSPSSPRNNHLQTSNSKIVQNSACSKPDEVSLLRVEIPHIEMERYSVMFSNQLQAAEQPSLLTRRQIPLAKIKLATKIRTKSIQNTRIPLPTQLTVPVPPRPSIPLSLAEPPAAASSAAVAIGLSESSSSPFFQTPDKPFHHKEALDSTVPPHLVVMIHRPRDSQQKDTLLSTKHTSRPRRPQPPSSSPTLLPSRSSSLPSHSSRVPPNTPQEASPTTGTASTPRAEISMARKISISKQQRQVLVPIVSRRTH